MSYVVNLGVAHRTSLLELVNHDNAATIGSPLNITNTTVQPEVDNGDATFTAQLVNIAYPADTVDVTYTKIALGDFVSMDELTNDFDWYAPDVWNDVEDIPQAIAAFKAAIVRGGVDPLNAMEDIAVTRRFDGVANAFFLDFTVASHVFQNAVSFRMPKHFSEDITVTDLNGFVFTAITAESVVY